MHGSMGACDVRSYVTLLVFDWTELGPPRGMVHVVVGGGLLDDDGCVYECLWLLLALRARLLFFFVIVGFPLEIQALCEMWPPGGYPLF